MAGLRFISEQQPTRVGVVTGYTDGTSTGTGLTAIDRLMGGFRWTCSASISAITKAGLGSRVELWGKQVLASDGEPCRNTIPTAL
jgi:alanine racemase